MSEEKIAAVPLFRTGNWKIGDPAGVFETLPEMKLSAKNLIRGKEAGLPDDFYGNFRFGWCEKGFLFCFSMHAPDPGNDAPWQEIYSDDSVEIMIYTADGTPFPAGPRCQIIVTPPDAEGRVRNTVIFDRARLPNLAFADGKLTPGGYEICGIVPWSSFGKGVDLLKEKSVRIHVMVNDYTLLPCGKKVWRRLSWNSISGSSMFKSPGLLTAFEFVDQPDEQKLYDLSPWIPLDLPKKYTAGNTFSLHSEHRLRVCFLDEENRVKKTLDFPAGKIEIPVSSRKKLLLVPGSELSGLPVKLKGGVFVSVTSFAEEASAVRKVFEKPSSAGEMNAALGVLSAIEFLKSGSIRAEEELFWRMRILKNESASNAPGLLRFLELARDPSGMVTSAVSRYQDLATVTVSCGALPVAYATIFDCRSREKALECFKAETCFLHDTVTPAAAGAEKACAGRCILCNDALVWDFDITRHVSLTSPDNPEKFLRLSPGEALLHHPEAFVCEEDAPGEQKEFFRRANIPEIAKDAPVPKGLLVHLGTFRYSAPLRAYQPSNGVESDTLVVLAGNFVIRTAYHIPALFEEFASLIIKGSPITGSTVLKWRSLLAMHLGGDLPGARKQGRLLRTGDVHTHNAYSDGHSTPGGLVAEASLCGMEFLVLSDHDTLEGAEKLLPVMEETKCLFPVTQGIEITTNRIYHINIFPVKKKIDSLLPYHELIEEGHRQGGICMLNHPMTYGRLLDPFWYRDAWKGTGLDAVERNFSRREVWKKTGTDPVYLGSTDTHGGMFGHLERSAVLAERADDPSIVRAVKERKAGMIAPNLREYAVGDKPFTDAVRACLCDPEGHRLWNERRNAFFAGMDVKTFIEKAPDTLDSEFEYGPAGDKDMKIVPFEE